MALITSKSQLNVGTELLIDEATREWELLAAGNLVAKDGVNLQAVYSKLVDLWNTSTYNDSTMPMRAGNVKAGNYIFGQDDSGQFNGWKPKNQATIDMLRNGGFLQYDAAGTLIEVYSGQVGLGVINSGAQPYSIADVGESPIDFPFDDQPNVPKKIYGDINNGNFDFRNASPKVFVREQGYLYTSSTLADTNSSLGGDIASFLLNNRIDDKITATDAEIESLPLYTGMSYSSYAANQQKDIGGVNYPFRRIVNANGGTIEEAYTYAQYLLRQSTDINTLTAVEIGKITDDFGSFNGSDFIAAQGVYFENLATASQSQMKLTDQTGTANIVFPSVAGGSLSFTPNMVTGGNGTYTLFYKTPVTGQPYGTGTGQVIVEDAAGNPITGNITNGSIPFDFAFSQNTQAGFAGGTTREVVLVGINPGYAKFQKFEGTISNSTTLVFSLVSQDDTAHEDYAA